MRYTEVKNVQTKKHQVGNVSFSHYVQQKCITSSKEHYVKVFDLTLLKESSGNLSCRLSLKVDLNIFHWHFIRQIYLGNLVRMFYILIEIQGELYRCSTITGFSLLDMWKAAKFTLQVDFVRGICNGLE